MTVKTFNVSDYALAAPTDALWWGATSRGETPLEHASEPDNLMAKGRLDLVRGTAASAGAGGGNGRSRKRNIHGLLNVISWGFMFPAGIVIARYLRVFPSANPAWFYLHVSCQVSGLWHRGGRLGAQASSLVVNRKASHILSNRNIGITLFALATLQMFALVLRPEKDHKYRSYWEHISPRNRVHDSCARHHQCVQRLDILKPQEKWRTTYIVVIAVRRNWLYYWKQSLGLSFYVGEIKLESKNEKIIFVIYFEKHKGREGSAVSKMLKLTYVRTTPVFRNSRTTTSKNRRNFRHWENSDATSPNLDPSVLHQLLNLTLERLSLLPPDQQQQEEVLHQQNDDIARSDRNSVTAPAAANGGGSQDADMKEQHHGPRKPYQNYSDRC
ncbi:hypothetical protein SASPL_124555 [Salvia splendens]|uniref:Cytochrome b561 domain-containing protein n=1 Tax=Salvia splendens TaxID=180675 RepID=A0A8X8ZNG8_SALSN|nr:hypothetical protein SASPL_124555 [Salvia splendens]